MAPIDDDTLDKLLTRHLSARLEGQVGRAESAFRRWVADDPAVLAAAGTAGAPVTGAATAFAEPDANEVAPLPALRLVADDHDLAGDDASDGLRTQVTTRPPPLPPARRLTPTGGPWGRGRWIASIVGTAVAASLGTLFVLPHVGVVHPASPGVMPVPNPPGGSSMAQSPVVGPTVHYVHDRIWDEGTVTPDDPSAGPMRQVREQRYEHLRYYDPDRHAMVDVVVPREQVKRYKMDTY